MKFASDDNSLSLDQNTNQLLMKLNPKSLIQPSEALSVELTGIHSILF